MQNKISNKLVPGVVFLVSAIVLYLMMPDQIKTTETTTFTARTFPTIALIMIGLCALILIIQGILALAKEKREIGESMTEKSTTAEQEIVPRSGNILMFIFVVVLLVVTAVIGDYTSLLVSGLLLGVGFLVLYRDKKILHYVIVVSVVVLSYFLFRQVFGLQLP